MLHQWGRSVILLFLLPCLAACEYQKVPESHTSAEPQSVNPGQPQPVKFLIPRTGIYRVPAGQLRPFGWTDKTFSNCSLTKQGAPARFWMEASEKGKALCFLGQAIESRYTPDAVYILTPGGEGQVIVETAQAGRAEAETKRVTCFNSTVLIEQNLLYEPRADLRVPWFWKRLVAPQKTELEVRLQQLSTGGCRLRVRLWAQTDALTSPDHHLRLAANGLPLLDRKWDGAGMKEIETQVPSGVLKEGRNTITAESAGDSGAAADIVFIDALEVSYPRRIETDQDDNLEFGGVSGPIQLKGSGFPITIAETSPGNRVFQLPSPNSTFRAEADHSYFAVGPKGFLRPARILPAKVAPDLRDLDLEADYIAIGSPQLLAPLGPLLKSLEDRKLKSLAVPADLIFDQFNHGISEPEAIRQFLRFAIQSWKRHPRYLLLVGDATYDTLGYLYPPDPLSLPGFFTRTTFGGETVTDIEFARLEADSAPELAVGRIPARTPDQVSSFVEKLLRFQAGARRSRSKSQVVAVADSSDSLFQREAQNFLDRLPGTYQKDLRVRGKAVTRSSPSAGQEDPHFFVYFGHGSLRQLGRDGAASANQDIEPFTGVKAPIVFHVTCLSGYFAHPKVESLAEELLLDRNSGVVALLAPTSLTLPEDQRSLTAALAASLGSGRRTLGEVVLKALGEMDASRAGQREVRNSFLLFGCPATPMER